MIKSFFAAALLTVVQTDAVPVFTPSSAVVVSESNNLVAHCSTFDFDRRGNVYFAYYRDSLQSVERSSNLSTFVVLARTKLRALDVFSRQRIISAGESIGTFTRGDRAPYDPNVLMLGRRLMVYFNGLRDGEVTFCCREYDTVSSRPADDVKVCNLRYLSASGNVVTTPLDARGVYGMFEDMGIEANYHNDVVISARFVRWRGEYYCALAGAFTKASKPVILRTSDGINFDVVFVCSDFEDGTCEACLEIVDGNFYVAARNAYGPKEKKGTYIACYDSRGHCAVKPVMLGRVQSKTALIYWRGQLLAFYNDYPDIIGEYGKVNRSRLCVASLGRDCRILTKSEITSGCGIHYPYVNIHHRRLFLSFTEDRRHVDIKQCRSNISFLELKL